MSDKLRQHKEYQQVGDNSFKSETHNLAQYFKVNAGNGTRVVELDKGNQQTYKNHLKMESNLDERPQCKQIIVDIHSSNLEAFETDNSDPGVGAKYSTVERNLSSSLELEGGG